jgi:hypothetical protein
MGSMFPWLGRVSLLSPVPKTMGSPFSYINKISLPACSNNWAVCSHRSAEFPCLPVPTTGQSVLTDRQNFPACLFQQLGSLFSQIGRISLPACSNNWTFCSYRSVEFPCLPIPTTGQSVLTDRQNFPACLFQQLGSLFSQIGRISLPACSNNWTVCSHRSVEFPLLRPVSTTGQSVS